MRIFVKAAGDGALLAAAYFIAFLIRFEGTIPERFQQLFLWTWPLVVGAKVILLHAFGQYQYFWRYTGVRELILADYALASDLVSFPRSTVFLDWFLGMAFLSAFRLSPRLAHEKGAPGSRRLPLARKSETPGAIHNVLLYGAGDLGESLVTQIARTYGSSRRVLGFIDDNPNLRRSVIHGVEVLGDRGVLPRVAAKHRIDEIIITISAISGARLREIVEACKPHAKSVQVAPSLDELFKGKVRVSDLREVQIEDLLGRESTKVDLDEPRLAEFIGGKTVLVTGAGGSIGSEICFQILKFQPKRIILFGRGENSIYATRHRLAPHANGTELHEVIGDIINYSKIEKVIETWRPELVFHAAADKHVPLMELNPDEAVLNNIVGTQNVLDAAQKYRAEKVVCISSDKAVNPTSVMGCCKRVTELLVQSQGLSRTTCCAVRFGNVLGSRGSVIPLFKKQIAEGGPITLTHPDITRYFMTIPEAVLLVLQAGALAAGGEIFLLEMGTPIKIADLARQMVRLSGLPEESIPLKFVGLRPGEKMEEELAFPFERAVKTPLAKLYWLESQQKPRTDLRVKTEHLRRLGIAMDFDAIQQALKELVPEYQPQWHRSTSATVARAAR
jgi:FlaA1/EpsC-like NDP-sugar epimerase